MLVDVSLVYFTVLVECLLAIGTQFYEYGGGSVFQVAATANGVTYSPTTPIATPIPQTSSTTSGSSLKNTVSTASVLITSFLLAALYVL